MIQKTIAKVWGGAKKVCIKVKEFVSENIIKPAARVLSSVAGRNIYDEAMVRLEELQGRHRKIEEEYKTHISNISKGISDTIYSINSYKKTLVEVDFLKFSSITDNIAEWEIVSKLQTDQNDLKPYEIEKLKNKEALVTLDFEKHNVAINYLTFASFGLSALFTRNKAKDTLENVIGQEQVFAHEEAKLLAEKAKYTAVFESLQNVELYFKELTSIYSRLLVQLDYSVNMLRASYYLIDPNYTGGKIDCRFLPEKHLLTLMASDKTTRILHDMVERKYISSVGEPIQKDLDELKQYSDNYKDSLSKIAA